MHLKMLGLAGVAAMALTAIVGPSGASASVLCETNVAINCPAEWQWNIAKKPEFKASLVSGSSAKLRDPVFGITINTCTESTVNGNLEAGTPVGTPRGTAHASFMSCTMPVTEATDGTIEVHSIAGSTSGTVTANGFALTFMDPFGNMCAYGFGNAVDVGNFVPSADGKDGVIAINKFVALSTAHSDAGCINGATFTATYTQTSTTPLWVSAS